MRPGEKAFAFFFALLQVQRVSSMLIFVGRSPSFGTRYIQPFFKKIGTIKRNGYLVWTV